MTKVILKVFLIIFLSGNLFASDIKDDDYKFEITLPSGWSEPKIQEAEKKDAISYSINRFDEKSAILILAFKVNNIKDLTDFVWTIEKDVTLNIPQKDSEVYLKFDEGYYDGMQMFYSDDNFRESIYYFRTKYTDTNSNFAYVVRFITPKDALSEKMKTEIKEIADSFKPVQ
ncbi:hypothetical protein FBQ84_02585 [Ignavibacteria bacterium CHB1]|jgi:hypothetical protein|nr:hypothetical protein [Ignavibacteria bacterium]MCC6886144.1 hypothetical protein [Ignavibacteriales bacterium]MDL1886716.1 hypothetical protein [Ignavibacteria bacterium CHB1]